MSARMLNEEAIFKVACRIDDQNVRADYLAQVCGSDTPLQARVEQLLSVYFEEPNYLESDESMTATMIVGDIPQSIGSFIGPYQILEQLAEGGMGVVYVAKQTEPVKRKVALKIIKPGMASKDVIARFEAERQTLALMEHPNIARIYDGGVTETGQPFFVMELVQGLPLTEYCNCHQLETKERLQLFHIVCRAVQHAHQRGIIHRDLKPSNIVVPRIDGQPIPKVIDFGVAKAINQKLTENSVYTHFAQLIGTPLYMSPEQAELGVIDIDVRSDVYSLGILLYELLTGTTPFDHESLMQASFDEMRRIIREDEPPRPSEKMDTLSAEAASTVSKQRHSDPRQLHNVLRGELDWIVMKALDKDRSNRYQSATALAKDIERYLLDEPVLARPPTKAFQLRRLARKHRKVLAVAITLTIVMLLATAVSTWQAIRASRLASELTISESQANSQRDRAQKAQAAAAKLARDRENQLVRSHLVAGTQHLNDENYPEAALYFAEAFRFDREIQNEWLHRTRLGTTLQKCIKPVRLWRAGKLASRLDVSPDGRFLASFEGENAVSSLTKLPAHVWELTTGRRVMTLAHEGAINDVSFGPNNRYVATASTDRTVRLWDLQSGQQVGTPMEHDFMVASVEFNHAGDRIVTSTGKLVAVNDGELESASNSSVTVWSVPYGKAICKIPHESFVRAAKFRPDDKLIATVAADSTARLWDASSGEPSSEPLIHRTLGGGKDFLGLAGLEFSLDGNWMITWTGVVGGGVSLNGHTWIWNAESGDLLQEPLAGRVCSLSRDGNQMVTSSANAVYLIRKERNNWLPLPLRKRSVTTADFSPFGRYVAINDFETSAVKVWDTQYRQAAFSPLYHSGIVQAIRFVDRRRLVTLDAQEQIRVWDLATAQQTGRHESVRSLDESNRGHEPTWITQLHGQTTASRVLVAKEIESKLTLRGHCESVLSPDGNRMLAYSSSQGRAQAQMWDLSSRRLLFSIEHDERFQQIQSVAFSLDGKNFATAVDGLSKKHNRFIGEARIWNAKTGQPVSPPLGHSSAVAHVAFSRDGSQLVTSSGVKKDLRQSRLGEARVWAVPSGKPATRALVQDGNVFWASFSSDGKKIVTTSQLQSSRTRCAVNVWDVETEQIELTIPYQFDVRCAEFLDSGSRIVTLASNMARVWNAETGAPLTPPMKLRISTWPGQLWQSEESLYINSKDYAQLWNVQNGYPVTAPMNISSGSSIANGGTLSSNTDVIFTTDEDGIWTWPIVRTKRPFVEILKSVQFLAGHKIDELNGRMPLSSRESEQFWKELNGSPNSLWKAAEDQIQNWERQSAQWHENAIHIHANQGDWNAVVAHATQVIELESAKTRRATSAYELRGDAHAQLDKFNQAASDFAVSLSSRSRMGYKQRLAYAYLGDGQLDRYRDLCAAMLDEIKSNTESSRIAESILIAQTSTAKPGTFSDWSKLLTMLESSKSNAASLTATAAVYIRAGQPAKALDLFQTTPKSDLKSFDYMFRAIANAQLEHFGQAIQDRELSNSLFGRRSYIDWQDRLRMRLLDAELESLLRSD